MPGAGSDVRKRKVTAGEATQRLIDLVQERKSIWYLADSGHKDGPMNNAKWNEIYGIMSGEILCFFHSVSLYLIFDKHNLSFQRSLVSK